MEIFFFLREGGGSFMEKKKETLTKCHHVHLRSKSGGKRVNTNIESSRKWHEFRDKTFALKTYNFTIFTTLNPENCLYCHKALFRSIENTGGGGLGCPH